MKKLLTLILALAFVFTAFGCGNTDTTESKDKPDVATTSTEGVSTTTAQNTTTISTTENVQTTTTTIPVVDTAEDLSADGTAMLDLLLDAETINTKLEELINNYNNDVTSTEDTVVALSNLQNELATVIANATATQWKTQRFTNYGERLATALDNLNKSFVYSIEGLNENSELKLTKAHGCRNSYNTESMNLSMEVERFI